MKAEFSLPDNKINASFTMPENNITASFDIPKGSGGTSDYNKLKNLPTINEVEIKGDLVADDLGLATSEQGAKADTALQSGDDISELNNNLGFVSGTTESLINYYTKSETYTQAEVNALIASLPKFKVLVVEELPQIGDKMTIYLVAKVGTAPDVYDEYIWIENSENYELIGSTAVDLTGYIKNKANGSGSVTILGTPANGANAVNIGNGAYTAGYAVSIGNSASSNGGYSISIGSGANTYGASSVAIGRSAKTNSSSAENALALGRQAEANAKGAIQLGKGANATANSMAIGFADIDGNGTAASYSMLDGTTGLIPDARLSSNIARSSDLDEKQNVLTAGTDLEIVEGGALVPLPEGYTQIEYITTDGTAYIDTGITVAETDTLDISFTDTSTPTTVMFITGRNGSDGQTMYFVSPSSSLIQWKGRPTGVTLAKGLEYNIVLKSGEVTYTNVYGTTTKTFTGGAISDTGTCLIGAGRSGATTIDSRKFIGNISKWQIKDSNNDLRFNGVPCYNSNNVYGLYDVVSDTFFPSIGTSDFTGGAEVVAGTVINFTGTMPTATSELTNDSGFIINTATGNSSITVNGTATAKSQAINIGTGSQATGNYGTALGAYSFGNASHAVGIGNYAKAMADYAIQLNKGTNSTANSLCVGFSTVNLKLLDSDGVVYAQSLQIGNTTLSETQLQSLLSLI